LRLWTIISIACFCIGLTTGCGTSRFGKKNSTLSSRLSTPIAPKSYDFEDIIIPGELKEIKKSTYVVQTSNFATGILALKGRVERNSLISFFQNNMRNSGWREITTFKSPRTSTIMLFNKNERWCVINIQAKQFNTYVEIGVAPTKGTIDEGLLK